MLRGLTRLALTSATKTTALITTTTTITTSLTSAATAAAAAAAARRTSTRAFATTLSREDLRLSRTANKLGQVVLDAETSADVVKAFDKAGKPVRLLLRDEPLRRVLRALRDCRRNNDAVMMLCQTHFDNADAGVQRAAAMARDCELEPNEPDFVTQMRAAGMFGIDDRSLWYAFFDVV